MKFYVVNSFAARPFGGNPAAVFPDAEGLDSQDMQAIARQMNLVETVFILRCCDGTVDFHLRYFTPTEELPVAGHPTIAAFITLVKSGKLIPHDRNEYRIHTGKGLVNVLVSQAGMEPVVFMEQPPARFGEAVADSALVADVLGIDLCDLLPDMPIVSVDTGLGHLIVPVKSLKALMCIQRNIEPLRALCKKFSVREVQAFTFEAYDAANQLHTRNICPREGIEDPACGVGNGALGAYLLKVARKDKQEIHFRAEQGTIVDMPSIINVSASRNGEGFDVKVGGSGIVMIEGCFHIGTASL